MKQVVVAYFKVLSQFLHRRAVIVHGKLGEKHRFTNPRCWLLGHRSLSKDFGPYVIIFMNVRVKTAVTVTDHKNAEKDLMK